MIAARANATRGIGGARTAAPLAADGVLAIAGNPNSGKTTLFNALTGLRHKVANYPGVTVEKREGLVRAPQRAACTCAATGTRCSHDTPEAAVRLLDLPGAYSLSARSPDEQIPRDVLLGRIPGTPRPAGVLLVVDASNLERNLYLATQVLEIGLPTVIACNMTDRAAAAGTPVDERALSRELGVPVVRTVGHQGEGLTELRQCLSRLSAADAGAVEAQASPARKRRWRLPEPVERSLSQLADRLVDARIATPLSADGAAVLFLTDVAAGDGDGAGGPGLPPDIHAAFAEQLRVLKAAGYDDVPGLVVEARYNWISELCAGVIRRHADAGRRVAISDRIDNVVTHRVLGPGIFAGLMAGMFWSIFSLAQPLMDAIETGQGWLQGLVRSLLPAGPLADLLADGLVGGVGSVVVFFPQICILFLFIALLEDSGYMARAAFLMDKLMSRVGLHGKSFIPLLSSFACAIPGIMATRTIENRRDRFTTILVAPLMSCSARLPVYLVIISVLFAGNVWLQTGIIFGMYALGTLAALGMALLLKRTLLRGPTPAFIMELPPYHLPRPWPVLRMMWDRSKLFLTRAGTTIVAICIVLWALAYFPQATTDSAPASPAAAVQAPQSEREAQASDLPVEASGADSASRQLADSYLGRMGRWIEPVVEPLGFDWKIGVGIVASFAAREVFVGTLGTLYSVADADESSSELRDRMRTDRWTAGPRAGRPVFTVASGLSLMVFYVLCCQCVSTLAVARRETQSWRWPAFMFAYMTALAYVASLAVYHVASWMGAGA